MPLSCRMVCRDEAGIAGKCMIYRLRERTERRSCPSSSGPRPQRTEGSADRRHHAASVPFLTAAAFFVFLGTAPKTGAVSFGVLMDCGATTPDGMLRQSDGAAALPLGTGSLRLAEGRPQSENRRAVLCHPRYSDNCRTCHHLAGRWAGQLRCRR